MLTAVRSIWQSLMPGLIPADHAAHRILSGLRRQKYEIITPRGFVFAMKLLRIVPNALFFWFVRTFV